MAQYGKDRKIPSVVKDYLSNVEDCKASSLALQKTLDELNALVNMQVEEDK